MTQDAPELPAPDLHVMVVLPPPVNGMSLVSQEMHARFTARVPIVDHGFSAPHLSGLRWRMTKHARFLGALLKATAAGLTRPRAARPVCYFVPDSGAGLWLNVLEAPFLRGAYREVWLHHHVFSYVDTRDARMARFLGLLGDRAQHITLGPAMSAGLAARYGVPADRLTALGNADFVGDIPADAPARPALRGLGFLSNITREKGIGLAMQTMAAVQAQAPEVTCQIAGPIEDDALRAEVAAFCAEAPETRRWLGPVYGEEKTAFFRATDVLLFPSQYPKEALPVTIYEALAMGAPVLATPRGCIPDQLAGTGWVFDEGAYVGEASATLTGWVQDPTAFATASAQAATRFAAQHAEARAVLDLLLTRIAPLR